MSHTLKNRLANLAIDILSDADNVEYFFDSVFIKVDRELWEDFQEMLSDNPHILPIKD
jgi:hypothetical protein